MKFAAYAKGGNASDFSKSNWASALIMDQRIRSFLASALLPHLWLRNYLDLC
jgi:hypothetical protein